MKFMKYHVLMLIFDLSSRTWYSILIITINIIINYLIIKT
jgi:hypothetical protein